MDIQFLLKIPSEVPLNWTVVLPIRCLVLQRSTLHWPWTKKSLSRKIGDLV